MSLRCIRPLNSYNWRQGLPQICLEESPWCSTGRLQNEESDLWCCCIVVCRKYECQTECDWLCREVSSSCYSCWQVSLCWWLLNRCQHCWGGHDVANTTIRTLWEARFLLRKWNSSHQSAIEHVSPDLKESHLSQVISPSEYTGTLRVEWNSIADVFRLTVAGLPSSDQLSKRLLTSDIAKTFDALEWFSPSIIKAKILLQKLWVEKINWNDAVPEAVLRVWEWWWSELTLMSDKEDGIGFY